MDTKRNTTAKPPQSIPGELSPEQLAIFEALAFRTGRSVSELLAAYAMSALASWGDVEDLVKVGKESAEEFLDDGGIPDVKDTTFNFRESQKKLDPAYPANLEKYWSMEREPRMCRCGKKPILIFTTTAKQQIVNYEATIECSCGMRGATASDLHRGIAIAIAQDDWANRVSAKPTIESAAVEELGQGAAKALQTIPVELSPEQLAIFEDLAARTDRSVGDLLAAYAMSSLDSWSEVVELVPVGKEAAERFVDDRDIPDVLDNMPLIHGGFTIEISPASRF